MTLADTGFPPPSQYLGAIGVGLLVASILLGAFYAYDHDYIFQRGLRTGRAGPMRRNELVRTAPRP